MTTFLTAELREGLAAARRLAARKTSRLRVEADGKVWPILRLWEGGFAMAAADAPQLRGLVNIHDGARHVMQALVIASEPEGDERRFDFKRATRAEDRAPVDFVRDDAAPVALIGSQ